MIMDIAGKKMKPLVIDRATWARGGRGGASGLKNGLGNRCCLGFACLQVHRKSIKAIMFKAVPSSVGIKVYYKARTVSNIRISGWSLESQMVTINDRYMTERRRERLLKKCFASVGIAARFVGKGFPKEPNP